MHRVCGKELDLKKQGRDLRNDGLKCIGLVWEKEVSWTHPYSDDFWLLWQRLGWCGGLSFKYAILLSVGHCFYYEAAFSILLSKPPVISGCVVCVCVGCPREDGGMNYLWFRARAMGRNSRAKRSIQRRLRTMFPVVGTAPEQCVTQGRAEPGGPRSLNLRSVQVLIACPCPWNVLEDLQEGKCIFLFKSKVPGAWVFFCAHPWSHLCISLSRFFLAKTLRTFLRSQSSGTAVWRLPCTLLT